VPGTGKHAPSDTEKGFVAVHAAHEEGDGHELGQVGEVEAMQEDNSGVNLADTDEALEEDDDNEEPDIIDDHLDNLWSDFRIWTGSEEAARRSTEGEA
jgi:hypothetical protein